MANADTVVTVDELHSAIRNAIVSAFQGFQTVDFYRHNETDGMDTPACLLEMTEVDPAPANDVGTGQFPALARFEARVILAAKGSGAKLEVRKAAISLATWLYLRRFPGANTDPSAVISVMPDEFAPNAATFVTWVIEFAIPVMFGESVWENDGTTPSAYYSFVPEIGAAHVADYTKLDDAP